MPPLRLYNLLPGRHGDELQQRERAPGEAPEVLLHDLRRERVVAQRGVAGDDLHGHAAEDVEPEHDEARHGDHGLPGGKQAAHEAPDHLKEQLKR